jgi:aspartyl aminopeptidase
MTLSKPPSPVTMTSIYQQQQNDEKYKKIKRKLKETVEVTKGPYLYHAKKKKLIMYIKKLNESLSKGFLRAKKKIRILTFERK